MFKKILLSVTLAFVMFSSPVQAQNRTNFGNWPCMEKSVFFELIEKGSGYKPKLRFLGNVSGAYINSQFPMGVATKMHGFVLVLDGPGNTGWGVFYSPAKNELSEGYQDVPYLCSIIYGDVGEVIQIDEVFEMYGEQGAEN